MARKHVWTPWSPFGTGLIQWPAFLFVTSIAAILLLIVACGSSSSDPTKVPEVLATAAPEASPNPTDSAGTPPEAAMRAARQELDTLIQLAQSERTIETGALTEYSEDVAGVLKRIDSDPQILQGFRKLLEDVLGVNFVFED